MKKKKKKKTVKPEPLNWSVSMFPTLWNGCGPVWGSPVAWPCLSPKVTPMLGKIEGKRTRGSRGCKEPSCNAGDLGSIPGSGRSPGEGNGNPFQYSCLGEPPWTEEPWRATVHVVTESDVTECQTLKHIVCGFSCKLHHMLAEQHSMQPDRKPGTSLF